MNVKHLKIIQFQESDLNALRYLFLSIRQKTFTWKDQTTFDLLDFDKETQGEDILTAFYDNKIVGFISVWMPTNFIHHLYIDEECQNRGIGKALLKAAIEKTKLPVRLKCLEKNTGAIEFYKRIGFTEKEKGGIKDDSYILFELNDEIE